MDAVTVRLILLRLALVIAVLAGLLAMHTLMTGPPQTAATAAVTVEHHPADTGGALSESATPEDCGSSGCHPLHALGFITCLLVLLVAWVLSGAAPPAARWRRALPVAALALVALLRSVAPQPPSLVALSISRT
jgi:hypothetical protein